MKHLEMNLDYRGVEPWCHHPTISETAKDEYVFDPRDADCTACLREAAGYGAAAAMRCAAVEAGAQRDEEITRERDRAIEHLANVHTVLAQNGKFICQSCQSFLNDQFIGTEIGAVRWCKACSASKS